jgi:hypothetical protein
MIFTLSPFCMCIPNELQYTSSNKTLIHIEWIGKITRGFSDLEQ